MLSNIGDKETDTVPVKEIKKDEPLTKDLVKPKMRDFNNSSEYMKARREYFEQLENQGGGVDEEEVIENELTEDELGQEYDLNNQENIDVKKRNIFKLKNNIFDFIKGKSKNVGLATKSLRSVNVQGDDEITLVKGGFGQLGKDEYGFYREERTMTKEALEAEKKFEEEQIGLTDKEINLDTKKEVKIKEEKQEDKKEERTTPLPIDQIMETRKETIDKRSKIK